LAGFSDYLLAIDFEGCSICHAENSERLGR